MDNFSAEEVRQVRKMINDHERLMIGFFGDGNGNRGVLWQWNDFLSRQDERLKMADEQMQTQKRKDSRRSLLIAVGMLIMTALLAYCAWRESLSKLAETQPVPSVYSTDPGAYS